MDTKTDLILEKIEDQKELIINKINEQKNVTDIRLNSIDNNLLEHMKRTTISEKRLEHIEDQLSLSGFLKMLLKLVVSAGAVSGAVYSVYKLINLF